MRLRENTTKEALFRTRSVLTETSFCLMISKGKTVSEGKEYLVLFGIFPEQRHAQSLQPCFSSNKATKLEHFFFLKQKKEKKNQTNISSKWLENNHLQCQCGKMEV